LYFSLDVEKCVVPQNDYKVSEMTTSSTRQPRIKICEKYDPFQCLILTFMTLYHS